MKKTGFYGVILVLLIISALTLTGCGGSSKDSLKTPSTNYFAYVMQENGNISVFSINSSGALSPISNIPTDSGSSTSSYTLAADPSGKFLYVAKYSSSNTVSVYSINPTTGALSPVAGSPFTTDNNPKKVVVDPTGNFVAIGCNSYLNIFSRDKTNGTLSSRVSFPFVSGQDLGAIGFDRTGQFLYVAVSTGYIYVYAKNAESNTFTQAGSTYTTGSGPTSLAFNPSGTHLFVSASSTTAIPIHLVNGNGSLDVYASLNILANPSSLIIDGNYLYIAKLTGISAYSIADPALIPEIGTVITLNNDGTVDTVIDLTNDIEPHSLTFDPSKKLVYVTGWDSNKIWGFLRNTTDGSLSGIAESPVTTEANIAAIITVKTTN